jgi:hypothetical protein
MNTPSSESEITGLDAAAVLLSVVPSITKSGS